MLLTNSFHQTSVFVSTPDFDYMAHMAGITQAVTLTDWQAKKVSRALCGIRECKCGTIHGADICGRQAVVIAFSLAKAEAFVEVAGQEGA